VATAPKMKPAKAAGKRNSLPASVEAPGETAHKQTEANDQSLATVPNAADTDAKLISKQLLAKAESLFKDFPRSGDIEELKKAIEWQTLNGFFRASGKAYVIASHTERDRRAWVREKLRSDRDAIVQLNAFKVFRIRQNGRSNAGIEQIRFALEEKLDSAMDEGMSDATEYIGESEAANNRDKPVGETGIAPAKTPSAFATAKQRSDKVCFRHGIIFRAIEARKTGLDYCDFLHDHGLNTPDSWRGDGCPDNYSLAYVRPGRKGNEWRDKIHKEKNRNDTLGSKLEREDPAELKRILGISRRPNP
jgi:hypothetical protein